MSDGDPSTSPLHRARVKCPLYLTVAHLILMLGLALTAAPAASAPTCFDVHTQQVLRAALDRALQEHITKLFAVLMTEQPGHPNRAINGARRAINSHRNALKSLECR
jgi:hypothetical protein